MTFEVFTALSIKTIVLWHVSLCTLVNCYMLLSYSVLKTMALCFSEDDNHLPDYTASDTR